MNRIIDSAIRIGLVLLSIGIVIYVLIASKFFAADQQLWFLRAGDYQSVIFISIAVIAATSVYGLFVIKEMKMLVKL